MIDPDNIILADKNKNNVINIDNIPEFDFEIWDLESEKELKKYFYAIEREVRHSYEYRELIQYIKNNYDMNKCSFIKVSGTDEVNVSIELHHYPFTLFDLVEIVYRKRVYYQERLDVELVAKEVTFLHYKLLVGLIPLSKTAHELVHDGKLFIPIQNVLGNYSKFIKMYKPFCTIEQLDIIDRLERYSTTESDLLNTSVLDMNTISFNVKDKSYQLPSFDNISNTMENRVMEIKQNQYALPVHNEIECNIVDNKVKEVIQPFYFIEKNK